MSHRHPAPTAEEKVIAQVRKVIAARGTTNMVHELEVLAILLQHMDAENAARFHVSIHA